MTVYSTRFRVRPLLALAAAVAMTAAACGADDGTDETTTEDPAAAGQQSDAMADDAMDDEAMAGGGHDHGDVLDVPEAMAIPEVGFRAEADPVAGMNVFIDVANFAITPENASTEPVDGEGHLHLYVDGERVMRFYNTAIHIGGLSEGDHEIAVEASANNHSAYAIDGEAIRATETVTVEASEHGHDAAESYDVDAADAPSIALEVTEDPKSGWNLFFDIDNFEFAPENASTEPVTGEGHVHLYVDGEKQGRIYGPWWHLPALPAGAHEIMIEVSANNHAPYAVDGKPVTATATVTSTSTGSVEAAASTDAETNAIAGDADLTIEATITGSEVTVSDDRFEVPLDSTVAIIVQSDVADEVHVHGYDYLIDAGPGEAGTIEFEADVPGVFEIELEGSGLFLFELAVAG